MNALTSRFPAVGAALICAFCFPPNAHAGMVLYSQCITSLGGMSNGLGATLQAGGLFYAWKGWTATVVGGGCTVANPAANLLFQGAAANGVNNINVNLANPLNTGQMMLFNSIRNNTGLNINATTFTFNGNPIGTKIGGAVTTVRGDPVIDITDDGSSAITLLSMIAQVGNSEDPLDPNILFEPDGESVTITPSLTSSDDTILPGETAEFTFPLEGADNWSFEYAYEDQGTEFTDLIASDVPEPSLVRLWGPVLVAFAASRIRRRRQTCDRARIQRSFSENQQNRAGGKVTEIQR